MALAGGEIKKGRRGERVKGRIHGSPSPFLPFSNPETEWTNPMSHLLQVGAGSGGMPVLDLLCRDSRITRVTLIEPDVYKPHNAERHIFPPSGVGELKAELAEQWLKERRPD